MRQFVCGLLFLGAWIMPMTSQAQEREIIKGATVSFQAQQVDFSDFNQQGRELGYAEFPGLSYEVGGGMMQVRDRWKTTVNLVLGLMSDNARNNQQESRYEYVGASLGTAFNLLNPDSKWFLGPEVTVLPRFEQVVLSNTPPVNGLAGAASAEYVKLTRFSSAVDVGLNLHRLVWYKFGNSKGAIIALRGGYRLDGEIDAWRVDQALGVNNIGILSGGLYGGVIVSFVY